MISTFQIFLFFVFFLTITVLYLGIKVVPQSKVYVIERFGKYTKTLESGLFEIASFSSAKLWEVKRLRRVKMLKTICFMFASREYL